MSARAPVAIRDLWLGVHKRIPHAVLSGIVGDVQHSFGYHLARRDLPASDYSVQLRRDRRGANDCASALDISLPPDLMRTCTHRLLDAARAKDPRLKALREFCGTLDGAVTYPWDLSTNSSEGPGTWDDSHLWHIHLSFYRAYADDTKALAPIADVLAGVPLNSTTEGLTMDKDVAAAFAAINAKLDALPAQVLSTRVKVWNGSTPTVASLLSAVHRYTNENRAAVAAVQQAVTSAVVSFDAAAAAASLRDRFLALIGGTQ